jgi:hypothetical protein
LGVANARVDETSLSSSEENELKLGMSVSSSMMRMSKREGDGKQSIRNRVYINEASERHTLSPPLGVFARLIGLRSSVAMVASSSSL